MKSGEKRRERGKKELGLKEHVKKSIRMKRC
jgi:hypothetical protein